MKKKCFFLLVCYCFSVKVWAAPNQELAVSLIPDSLRQNADAVYRFCTTQYQRNTVAQLTQNVHCAVTVLNKNGNKHAHIQLSYDRLIKVNNLQITLYDPSGNKIKELGKSEVQDFSAYPSFTLYSDQRVKQAAANHNTYPYTVEYTYQITYNGVVGIDTWYPVPGYRTAVQKAELIFTTPAAIGINFLPINDPPITHRQITEGSAITHHWQVNACKAIIPQPLSPPISKVLPAVLLAPAAFEYDQTYGNFNSWQTYGNWAYNLLQNRDVLPPATIAEVNKLTADIADPKAKAKKIYEYMQSKTRYVNIATGIGGFQPISAADVDKYGYGDCKALSNYTKSLLKIAGLNAHYTEIGSGPNQQLSYPDFASANQTNHVIICLPLQQDTLWLECTSQKLPFGFIGKGNANRYALAITEQGGKVCKTPHYTAANNVQHTTAQVILQPNTDARITLSAYHTNLAYEPIFDLAQLSPQEQQNVLSGAYPFAQLSIHAFTVADSSAHHQPKYDAYGALQFTATAARAFSAAGNRWIVPCNLFHPFTNPLPDVKNRTTPIYIAQGFTQTDVVTFTFPDNFAPEHVPQTSAATSIAGEYKASFTANQNKLTYTRTLKLHNGTYAAEHAHNIAAFFEAVSAYDAQKFILLKQP
ncbi:MAG TPA: DUF3857 domain-containing transglutaminase family protein [Chitinophagales bacterium]|nr:DUF3857 domain-containing transglutaminase family protein [Chitinophagales bacterium]HRK26788.1 DUF3857 domain-containing transglutaminase family protein [Chitinophagales bacterium]